MSLLCHCCVCCCITAAGHCPPCSFGAELLGVTSWGQALHQLTGTMGGFAQWQELTWVWARPWSRPWSLWVQEGDLLGWCVSSKGTGRSQERRCWSPGCWEGGWQVPGDQEWSWQLDTDLGVCGGWPRGGWEPCLTKPSLLWLRTLWSVVGDTLGHRSVATAMPEGLLA